MARTSQVRATSAPFDEKIVTELGEIDFKRRTISHSMRSTLANCPRMFQFSYGHGLRARGVKDYFFIGGAFGDELQLMRENGRFNQKAARKRIAKRKDSALLEAVGGQAEKIEKAAALVEGMLAAYASHYLEHDVRHFEFLEHEGEIHKAIPDTRWTYIGFRDSVATARRQVYGIDRGRTVLFEDKTTGQLDASYVARIPLDFQILGYVWSLEDEDYGDCADVMYNVAQKSRLRQKQSETFPQYLDRVVADYLDDPTKYFYRERVQVGRPQVASFVTELSRFVNQVLEPMLKSGYFPMNTGHCGEYGGCDFAPLCIDGPTADNLALYARKRSDAGKAPAKKRRRRKAGTK